MKKTISILCLNLLLALAACHHGHCATFRVLASTFPVYVMAANVCAEAPNVAVELLVPAAAGCPHDFAPKPADIQKLATANAIIINGAGLEEFLAKPIANLELKPEIIDAGANVPVIDSEDAGHGHINPHIFASPGCAALMTMNIAAKLAALDPANKALYEKNGAAYAERLKSLSAAFKEIGAKAKNRGIALEHDALAYLALNADLEIVGIFENSASAAQLAKIQLELKARKPALLAGDAQFPDKLLRALSQESGIPFAQLNTCASGPANAPLDYYEQTMRANLAILEKYFAGN